MKISDNKEKNRIMRSYACAQRKAMLTLFSDIPLRSPSQHYILFRIEDGTSNGNLPSQRELAREMQLTPATVTATLSYLEKLGLIQRESDDEDQRINRVRITEAGKTLANELRRRMGALDEFMFEGFTPEEITHFGAYIRRITENLYRFESIHKEEN